jgi:hypothetical protein
VLDSLCEEEDNEIDVEFFPSEEAESEPDMAQYVVEESITRRNTCAAAFSQDYKGYLCDRLDGDRKLKR